MGPGAGGAEQPGGGADEAACHSALEAEFLGTDPEVEEEDARKAGAFLDCSERCGRVPLRAHAAACLGLLLVLALQMSSGRRHVRIGLEPRWRRRGRARSLAVALLLQCAWHGWGSW